MGTQLGHRIGGVDGLARFHLTDALTKRVVQSFSFFVVEIVAAPVVASTRLMSWSPTTNISPVIGSRVIA